ncbi:MAG: shikimate kinase, partial [Candidatus Peribacteraceae bacterium]
THISGARNLRLKETNRLKVLTSELKKAGIKISEMEDGLLVQGDSAVKSAVLDAHGDHRMAMCFAILGSVHPGIRIKNSECVSKSYPHFFRDLMTLHTFSRCIALVGMRGCGKSSLAKKLASKLPLKRIDTDTVFERHYGRIGDFVQKKGWKAFRLKEEQIVAQSLQTGSIVSLGGGAIESAKSRRLLQNVIVLWLEASVQGTVKRLQKTHRPALTDLPLQEEVSLMLKKRNPLYKSVANITLPEKIPFSKQTSFVLSRLRALCSR